MKIISACLCGLCTNIHGNSSGNAVFIHLLKTGEAIPLCPEQLGGLPTPRRASEIIGGDGADVLEGNARVVTQEGEDVTRQYIAGAEEALKVATLVQPDLIILNEKSPSCGVGRIYDGSFSGALTEGCGITTALLKKHNFNIVSDEDYK